MKYHPRWDTMVVEVTVVVDSVEELKLDTGEVALVDLEDLPRVRGGHWRYEKSKCRWYVRGQPAGVSTHRKISLHRFLLGIKDRRFVDHINGNTLDNRKQNLRPATNSENMQNRIGLAANNTSGYRGVSYFKPKNRWRAYLKIDGRFVILGYFRTPEEANAAAQEGRRKHMPYASENRSSTS